MYVIPAFQFWIPGRPDPVLVLPDFQPDPTADRGRPKVEDLGDLASYGRIPTVVVPNPDGKSARHRVPPELIQLASDALRMPTPDEERHQKGRKRQEEMVSRGFVTCGICFRAIGPTARGYVSSHGYRMGGGGWGHGHQGMHKDTGDCFGAGWTPWQIDHNAATAWVRRLEGRIPHLMEQVRLWREEDTSLGDSFRVVRLRDGSVRPANVWGGENLDDPTSLPRGAEAVAVERGSPGWRTICRIRLTGAEGDLRATQDEITFYQGAIRGWPALPTLG